MNVADFQNTVNTKNSLDLYVTYSISHCILGIKLHMISTGKKRKLPPSHKAATFLSFTKPNAN